MPELRKDPIIGRWVIIAVERARRPNKYRAVLAEEPEETDCPFCEGQEARTPHEIFALRQEGTQANQPGWNIRVVPSKSPFLKIEGEINRHGRGVYDVMGGIGAHEIIVETPQHVTNFAELNVEQIARVIACSIERFLDLSNDKRFKYVLIFKNYGSEAGVVKTGHSRMQMIATPVTPKRVKEELVGAKKYYEFHERCVFCDLIRQETADEKRVVFEMDGFVVLTAFASRFPFEVWILPKKHDCDFFKMSVEDRMNLSRALKKILNIFKTGLEDPSYSLVLHTSPFRREGSPEGYWKTIKDDYHWHIEIIPRLTTHAGFEWGTGFYICPITPEEAAKYLVTVEKR